MCEAAHIAYCLKVTEMIVAVNKMETRGWSESAFNSIKHQTSNFLKHIGYAPHKIHFIPVSSLDGQNISTPKGDLSWYHGKTLVDAIDSIQDRPTSLIDQPLRIPIRRVYQVPGVGKVPVGCVVTGTITTGMSVTIAPGGITATVKSLESHGKRIDKGCPGDLVTFDLGVEADFWRGQVVSDSNSPATPCSSFIAMFRHRAWHSPRKIHNGYTPVLHCGTAQVPCKFELLAAVDRRSGRASEKNPKFISIGSASWVKLTPLKPICVTPVAECLPLGKFIVRDLGKTIGAGDIQSVEKC